MLNEWNLAGMALVAVLCFIAGWPRRAGSVHAKPESGSPRILGLPWETAVPTLLIALGAALRGWQLFVARNAVLPEELHTLLQARSLLVSGTSLEGLSWPAILTGWAGEAEGMLPVWLSMPLVALLGVSALALRLPVFVLSVFCLWVLWDLIRRSFSKSLAVWALLLAAVAPWQLMASRWPLAWELFPYLLLISAWALSKKRPVWFAVGMLTLGLGMYTIDAAWCTAPLLAVVWAMLCVRRRVLRLPAAVAGIAVFLLVAAPLLLTLARGGTDFPHQPELIVANPSPVTSTFYARSGTPQKGYGPQWLPFFKESPGFASLFLQLSANGYRALQSTALQFTEDPGYTTAYLLQDWGFLFVFLIPLTFFGAVCLLVRGEKQKRDKRLTAGLLFAWPLCALPFLLLFGKLAPPHYVSLLYPLLLCTAYGARMAARWFRPAGVVFAALCAAGALAFSAWAYDPIPAFPGLQDALKNARERPGNQVVITMRLYPNEDPARAAKLNVLAAFDLDAEYARGEAAMPSVLPYEERFKYVVYSHYDTNQVPTPGYEADPLADAVYVMHQSEALLVDPYHFTMETFGEFVVARGR